MNTPLVKTYIQVREQILKNIVKMITYRGLLNKDNLDDNIKKITSKHPDDLIYNLELNDKSIYKIKFFNQVVTTIKKPVEIVNFLDNTPQGMLVVQDIKQTAHNKIYKSYPNIEVFSENELMINLIGKNIVPDEFYKIIDSKDKDYETKINEFLKDYNTKIIKKIPLIKEFDPMAKYLFCKPGDIIKIIRYSSASLKSPYYRLVIKSTININTKNI